MEIKTRTSTFFENPIQAVTIQKQKFMIKAVQAYIEKYNIQIETRFDIIGISIINNKVQIEHIEDAFQPSLI